MKKEFAVNIGRQLLRASVAAVEGNGSIALSPNLFLDPDKPVDYEGQLKRLGKLGFDHDTLDEMLKKHGVSTGSVPEAAVKFNEDLRTMAEEVVKTAFAQQTSHQVELQTHNKTPEQIKAGIEELEKEHGAAFKLNLVERDHNQSDFENQQNPAADDRLEGAKIFCSLNEKGPKLFGFYETGGQEPGAHFMNYRDPDDLFKKLNNAVSEENGLRHLFRGYCGNHLESRHENDLGKWMDYLHETTNGKTTLKIFDYNNNLDEFKGAALMAREKGIKVEIAIPHSPDMDLGKYAKTVDELAEFAGQNGCTLSIKRMVAGLKVDEAEAIADIAFSAAQKYGIKHVGLHAHGDHPQSVAAFIVKGMEYGIHSNADFVHEGSGATPDAAGTFASAMGIINAVEARCKEKGIDYTTGITQEQKSGLSEADKVFKSIDKKNEGSRARSGWTPTEIVDEMRMPNGGQSYSLKAVENSQYFAKLKEKFADVPEEEVFQMAKDIFKGAYVKFKEDFGKPTGVTPGHKRIETGAIYAVDRIIDEVMIKCISGNKVNMEALSNQLNSKSYEQLYDGLSPVIVDAFRNDRLQEDLTMDAMKFLCSQHMKNTLDKREFSCLDKSDKEAIIAVAHDRDKVVKLVETLNEIYDLPQEVLGSRDGKFSSLDLKAASGKREYIENATAVEQFDKCMIELRKKTDEGRTIGIAGGDIEKAALFSAVLGVGGLPHLYVQGIQYASPMPNFEGKTTLEIAQAKAKFMASPIGHNVTYDVKPNELKQAANDGYLAGAGESDLLQDTPEAKFSPRQVSPVVSGQKQHVL